MQKDSQELSHYLAAGYVLVQIVTWEEERALSLTKESGTLLSRPVSVWSLTRGFGEKDVAPGSAAEGLARIGAAADPRLFVLLDFHSQLHDPVVLRKLRDLVPLLESRHQSIVFIGPLSMVPTDLEKDMLILDLDPPGPDELREILVQTLKEVRTPTNLQSDDSLQDAVVRAARGLTAREMKRMIKRLIHQNPEFSREHVKRVLEEKRRILRRSELLEFYEITEELDNVGGLDLLKKWLTARAEAFGEKARSYGLPEPKGLLLLGVQGCGKSLSAKAVSALWGIPLIRLDLTAILGRESEGEQLQRSLRMAEGLSPCVLWIDEIEKGFSHHRVSGSEAHGKMARAFASFLTWLQEKTSPVYVIATANTISELPPELVRKGRFDDIFFVDLPRPAERSEIFRIHLEKRNREPQNYELDELAASTEGFSGSEIEQAVISAMYEAFTDGREFETKDILRAVAETVPLSETMEEEIKALRDWAKTRARPASLDTRLMDLLGGNSRE
ncbi:MAG: AAA family ATPase [bacterium]